MVSSSLPVLESFYEIAYKRDDAFLRNSLKRMEKDRDRAAILITGGFHTKNLTRLFMENGIAYLVITPNLSQKTDDELYDRILKESYRTRTWDE